MKRNTLILYLFISSVAFSQIIKTDSLLSVYFDKNQVDTSRLKAINALAYSLKDNNPDSAIILANEQLKFANTLNEKKIGRASCRERV